MPRKPDKREQKRIDKHNLEEESRRAKAILMVKDGRSFREVAAVLDRSHMYVAYWTGIAMEKRVRRFIPAEGWRDLIKVKKPGPPAGRYMKRELYRAKAVGAKQTYPNMGCAKLVKICELAISGPTLCGILKSEGLIEPRKKAKREGKRFRAGKPNDMWQIDYVHLGHGYNLLTVLDDCSGKILSWNLRRMTKLEDVLEILDECFREYGTPRTILSDHGTQWYATRGGDSRFDEMCLDKGIKHIMGRIRHPQTQGKAERFHGVLKKETNILGIADRREKGKVLEDYVRFYNGVRPHWGIGLKVPNSVYYAVI